MLTCGMAYKSASSPQHSTEIYVEEKHGNLDKRKRPFKDLLNGSL